MIRVSFTSCSKCPPQRQDVDADSAGGCVYVRGGVVEELSVLLLRFAVNLNLLWKIKFVK